MRKCFDVFEEFLNEKFERLGGPLDEFTVAMQGYFIKYSNIDTH